MKFHFQCYRFEELSAQQIYDILQLRTEVFVLEQACLYQDLDYKDQQCWHLWYENDQQKTVAYLRVLPHGLSYPEVSIGRVLVHEDYRRHGLAKALLLEAFAMIEKEFGSENIQIGAQAYLEGFYKQLGFEAVSDVYNEDSIAHIDMIKKFNHKP